MEDAIKLFKKYGTNNPLKIAEEMGILILYEDLGRDTWGYYTRINRIPAIHINNRLNEFGIKFTVGHELGHHMKHSGLNTPFLRKVTLFSLDRIEREANRFAVHLLIAGGTPEFGETKETFLLRHGIPIDFHDFY